MNEIVDAYVRPFVTVSLTLVFCYLAVMGDITADVFVPTVTMVLIYWFKSRDDEKKSEQVIAQIKESKLPPPPAPPQPPDPMDTGAAQLRA
jgi:hypothetical protein